MLNRFLALNRAASERIDARRPYARESFGGLYTRHVIEALTTGDRVTDVGAGRRTPYADHLPPGCELVGVDLLGDDLRANPALAVRVSRDVIVDGLPKEAEGSAAVTSQFVLEHLPDLDRFASEARRVLKPGGRTVHLFAGRRSPFALLNRAMPEAVARRLLFSLRPESATVGGFTTHYDRTDPAAARAVFENAGFVDVHTEVTWESSQYFKWFLPLFLVVRAWERLARRRTWEGLASYIVLVGRVPGDH